MEFDSLSDWNGRIDCPEKSGTTALQRRVRELEALASELKREVQIRDHLLEHCRIGFIRFRLERSGSLRLEYMSGPALALFGMNPGSLPDSFESLISCIVEEERETFRRAAVSAVICGEPFGWEGRCFRGREEVILKLDLDCYCGGDGSRVYSGTIDDVSESRRTEKRTDILFGRIARIAEEMDQFKDLYGKYLPARIDLAARLSARETEVMDLMLRGFSNADICDLLCISLSTVKKHINALFSKLGVKNRFELLLLNPRRNSSYSRV